MAKRVFCSSCGEEVEDSGGYCLLGHALRPAAQPSQFAVLRAQVDEAFEEGSLEAPPDEAFVAPASPVSKAPELQDATPATPAPAPPDPLTARVPVAVSAATTGQVSDALRELARAQTDFEPLFGPTHTETPPAAPTPTSPKPGAAAPAPAAPPPVPPQRPTRSPAHTSSPANPAVYGALAADVAAGPDPIAAFAPATMMDWGPQRRLRFLGRGAS